MSEWKEYKMEELMEEIAMGPFGSNIKVDCFTDEGIPVLNGSNLVGFKLNEDSFNYVTKEKADSLGRSNAYRGDVVITHRGTLGQVVYVPYDSKHERYVISQSQFRFKCNKKLVDVPFLVYYFHSREGQYKLLANASQVGVPALARPTSTFKEIVVALPPLEEQRRIASILTSLDDKIDLLRRENATLEAMAETLFRQWFVVEAKEEWEEGKLGDMIKVKYGKDHKKLLDGKIPVIGSGGIMRYADTALYDKESVLIPRKGSLNNVMYMNEPFWTVDTMFYTEMRRHNIAKYVFHFMKSQDLANMNVGSAVPSMTTEVLNNIPIDIPPQEVFDRFENAVASLYNKKEQNYKQIQTLTQTRDGLLPRLMSGEVKV